MVQYRCHKLSLAVVVVFRRRGMVLKYTLIHREMRPLQQAERSTNIVMVKTWRSLVHFIRSLNVLCI